MWRPRAADEPVTPHTRVNDDNVCDDGQPHSLSQDGRSDKLLSCMRALRYLDLWGNRLQSEEQAQKLAWALGMKREYVRV